MLTEAEKKALRDLESKKVSDEAARKAKSKTDLESDVDDEGDDEGDPGDKTLSFSPEQKAYVDGLRKENARARVKNKELESGLSTTNERLSKFEGGLKKLFGDEGDKNLTAEERLDRLEQRTNQEREQNEQLAMHTALKDAAIENGVGKADYDYFEFLVGKRLQALSEDEELGEEDLAEIAKQAKAKNAAKSTSVDGSGPDPDEDDGEVTLEEFIGLGIGARSAIYQKDKSLYEKLVAAEKAHKKRK